MSQSILSILFTFIQKAPTVYNLVQVSKDIVNGDEKLTIDKVFSEIGDVRIKTAKRILFEDLPQSNDPVSRIEEALGHFNSALDLFEESYQRSKNKKISLFRNLDLLSRRIFIASIFISYCYFLINELELHETYYYKARKIFYKSYALHTMFPRTNSIQLNGSFEYRVGKLCEQMAADELSAEQKQSLATALSALLDSEPADPLTAENLGETKKFLVKAITKKSPDAPDKLEAFLDELAGYMGESYPLDTQKLQLNKITNVELYKIPVASLLGVFMHFSIKNKISKIDTLSLDEQQFITVSNSIFKIPQWKPTCPKSNDLKVKEDYYYADDVLKTINKYYLKEWNPPSE